MGAISPLLYQSVEMPNYIQFYRQGNVEAKSLSSEYQSDWFYLEIPLTGIQRGGGATPPDIEQSTGYLLFDSNSVETTVGSISLPHGIDIDGVFLPVVKWTKTSSAAGGVAWNFKYIATSPGEIIPSTETDLGIGVNAPNYQNDDTMNKMAIDFWEQEEFDDTSDDFRPLGEVITMQLIRQVNHASDTYGADARVMSFGILCQVNCLGSEEPLVK